jgi:hypothetical protein
MLARWDLSILCIWFPVHALTRTVSSLPIAVVDLLSSAVWLWEVVSLAAGSPSSPARMAFAICARPTILLVVSLLSYMNVVRGKVVDLGKFDFIVWIPSLVLLGNLELGLLDFQA